MGTAVTGEILFREKVLFEGAAEDQRVLVAAYVFNVSVCMSVVNYKILAQEKFLEELVTSEQRCWGTVRPWRWLFASVTGMSFFRTMARMTDTSWAASVSFLPWTAEDTERP